LWGQSDEQLTYDAFAEHQRKLQRISLEMNWDDNVLAVIRLILRRAQTHAFPQNAIVA